MKNSFTPSAILAAGAALTVAALFAGCTPMPTALDKSFGSSLNTLKAHQIIDHHASARTDHPAMDGRAAQDAIGLYQKSFSAPTPHQNVFTIGVSQ
jgi:hypothetical protein